MVGYVEVVPHKVHKTNMLKVMVDEKSRPLFVSPTKAKVLYDHIEELKQFVDENYNYEWTGYNEPPKAP